MTNREAVAELKMLFTKHRGDFYPQTREALTLAINALYDADTSHDEWCGTCREYDKERGCCPRFNRVIRSTVEEIRNVD